MSDSGAIDIEKLGIETVEGVGPAMVKVLAGLGIATVADLLRHYPHRYLDLSTVKKIAEVREGEEVTVVGEVMEVDRRAARRGRLTILTVTIFDGTGYVKGVWFNQKYIADRLTKGTKAAFSGRVDWRYGALQISQPHYDLFDDEQESEALNTGRIIPVHSTTGRLTVSRLRAIVKKALDRFSRETRETLPKDIIDRLGLTAAGLAIKQIHFPDNTDRLRSAKIRLVFDEFFHLELGLALMKRYRGEHARGISHKIAPDALDRFCRGLPWALTRDQQKALAQIRADLSGARPMNRILLGEVGSGKTIVAAAAMLMVVTGGYQAALMAPTEILAEQHYLNLHKRLEDLGMPVALVLGGQKGAEKQEVRDKVASGRARIVIGTHSLIQQQVDFAKLGLVVIDEQQRFGVRQRLELRAKGKDPDMLVMTATPIPRTLALTLYGDLDLSVLAERPGGRAIAGHIVTKYISESRRDRAYQLIRREVGQGRRAYIVCPLIDESDKLQVKSVLSEAATLKEKIFADLRVGVIHGRAPAVEKEEIMGRFRSGALDILIATTVVEVGVDVPEATVMMIEHSERFGLAQLHQLRGRVGRGPWPSYCLLLGNLKTEDAKARVRAMLRINDGFLLAEEDLRIRGEGQIFGAKQSGLPDLKLAKLTKHVKVLEAARHEAFALAERDPKLSDPKHAALKAELRRRFSGQLDWLMSG